MINHTDNMSLRLSEIKSIVPTFRTKKQAIDAGSQFGWRDAVKFTDRFEKGWIVGRKFFGDDEIAGVKRAHYRFPLLKWEKNDGVEFCPVLDVYRILNPVF